MTSAAVARTTRSATPQPVLSRIAAPRYRQMGVDEVLVWPDGDLFGSAVDVPTLVVGGTGSATGAPITPPPQYSTPMRYMAPILPDLAELLSRTPHKQSITLSSALGEFDPRQFNVYLSNDVNEAALVLEGAKDRIRLLKRDAADDERPFSEESADALLRFVEWFRTTVKPLVFLMDNGNLRAAWKGKDGSQVALEFAKADRVQYVIFSKLGADGARHRSVGWNDQHGVKNIVEAHKLQGLLIK